MPIIVRKVSRRGADRLGEHVTQLLREKMVPPGVPREIRPDELSYSEPHALYFVSLDGLAEGKLLGVATQTSWRYLLARGETPIAEVELSAKPRRGKGGSAEEFEFLGLTQGPFIAATIEALGVAEQLPQVAKADYELRMLKVPSVYLAALWLHGKDDDILVPMADPPGGLRKNRPYSEEQVIKALREIAVQTKRFHDSYKKNQPKPRRRGK